MLRIVTLGLAAALAGPAQADLTLCNRADAARSVAIAYADGNGGWVSEGWWTVDPGACRAVLDGPLRQRHYYYTLSGEPGFAGDGYSFCVQTRAFTQTGADGDCAALGAEARPFAHIDTGATAESHSADLAALAVPKGHAAAPKSAPAEAPADAAGTASFSPGTLGEPFSVTALMQGCDAVEGFQGCTFYAEGWRWMVAEGSGSNPAALAAMAALPVNAAVQVTGDVISYGDITVEAAVSQVVQVAPDGFAAVRDALQGHWVSQDDPASAFVLFGSEARDLYDGQIVGEMLVTLADRCPDGDPIGTVMVQRTFGGDPDDVLCLAVIDVTGDRLEVSNVGRGNTLVYARP